MIGRIYKIYRDADKKTVYIGSTFKTLCIRFSNHKSKFKRYLNGKCPFVSSFDIVKFNDADIHLIKEVEVKDKNELRQIEDDFITIYNDLGFNIINIRRAFTTQNEKKEYFKQYYKQYCEQHKEQHKEYYEQHKEEQKEQNKEYYEQHKEEINMKRKQKFNCACGGKFTKASASTHTRSVKHITYINNCNVTIINKKN